MNRRTLFLFALLCGLSAAEARSQSGSVSVDIELESPSPTCTLSVSSDLDYGTAEKPTTGTGSVTVSTTTGSRTTSGVTASGSHSVGQATLSGSHVSSYTVSRTFPSSLTRSGGSLTFTGAWAQSANASSGYSVVSAASYTGTAGGAGSTFSRYFRFGGEVSGIGDTDPDGEYDGSISASATCS